MKISFILNGEIVHVQTDPGERLVTILREDFHLIGTKAGCMQGRCGSCTVLINKKPVPSCLVPAFEAQNKRIETIESFKLTDEFNDIKQGFDDANVQMCGYCDNGKYLIAESILEKTLQPDESCILEHFSGCICKCTVKKELVAGIQKAASIRRSRLYDSK